MALSFGSLAHSVSSLFSATPQGASILGIDIGSSAIKVVQMKNKGGVAVLETYGEIALGPYAETEIGRATNLPPEKITAALMDVIKESNVTTKACAVAIPFSASLVSLIKMPAVSQGQLAQMVPIEARKYIPVPITEVTLDWFVLPEEEHIESAGEEASGAAPTGARGTIDVLLVAINNQVIEKYRRIIADAGLEASFFEIEVFSTVRAALEHGIAPTAIIDMGAATTKLYIVEHGIVRESHVINRGSQDVTLSAAKALTISVARAEEMKRQFGIAGGEGDAGKLKDVAHLPIDAAFSEASRALLAYQSRRKKNIAQVILVGGGSALKGIVPFAKERFAAEAVIGNPFGKTQTPAFLEQTLKEAGPEFAVAVGVALRKLQEES